MDAIEGWIGPLGEEVKNVQRLVLLLREIGCFTPPPSTRTAVGSSQHGDSSLPVSMQPVHGAGTSAADNPVSSTALISKNTALSTGPGEGVKPTCGVNGANGELPTSTAGGSQAQGGGCATESYNLRAAESQALEAVEGLRFHLSALRGAVDNAHINMRVAGQQFALLLKKVMLTDRYSAQSALFGMHGRMIVLSDNTFCFAEGS